MIKIFGGLAKGLTLKSPPNLKTRPTSILLRRKFFDSMQSLEGFHFFDLCAGTGSVGLEAASRRAESVTFIENYKSVYKVLKDNVKLLSDRHPELRSLKTHFIDFKKFMQRQSFGPNTILFFDPPYEKREEYQAFFNLLKEKEFSGKVIVEGCENKTMPLNEFYQVFGEPQKTYKQSQHYFVVYEY
mgnify:CR=1 FL=1